MCKGSKHSPEARAKMSLAKKGIPLSPEARAAMSAANKTSPAAIAQRAVLHAMLKGRKRTPFTPEHLAAMSAARKGKSPSPQCQEAARLARKGKALSPDHRAAIGKAQRGPKNHQWMGGISCQSYGWEFNDELKEEVRRRDNHRCQVCGTPQDECDTALDVHHIDYDKKNSDPVNLVVLCHGCHSRTNKNRPRWTAFFQARDLERLTRKE